MISAATTAANLHVCCRLEGMSDEQWLKPEGVLQRSHLLIAWPLREPLGGIDHLRQDVNVANGVEEDPFPASTQLTAMSMAP
jgi:hypothetical protein